MKRMTWFAVAGLALTLTACAAEPPVVSATPSVDAAAAVTEERAQTIVDETFAELAAADRKHDATLLSGRFTGDAATVRAAQYVVANAVASAPPVTLPSDMQRVYVSGSETWPRIMVAVSEAASDAETPVVYLWVQESIDQPYKLTSWAHMVPGAVLPPMPGPSDGAQQLSTTGAGVTPTPADAIGQYVEYLRQGASSELAASFGADAYAQQLFAARDTLSAAAATGSGAYVDTVQPDLDHTYVLSTQDGGALVFAPVQVTSSMVVSGATLKVSDRDAPLLTAPTSTRVTYTYRDLVVLHIPAPSGGLPTVVAADHLLVSVKPE